ncbi:hypothetical protein BKM31_29335 [[Actinomadura] parvosata subsp. kistnae]|uniref:Uncharacterized protein n=1 Tax=[Actinomadura] parvosata subsp. kistnae TaxID=1909395 RepID=A0A1V0A477_9ACTN|nr:hypothetical protein BKM31_29335 [Nonomuraea sp. ATCC 55076]
MLGRVGSQHLDRDVGLNRRDHQVARASGHLHPLATQQLPAVGQDPRRHTRGREGGSGDEGEQVSGQVVGDVAGDGGGQAVGGRADHQGLRAGQAAAFVQAPDDAQLDPEQVHVACRVRHGSPPWYVTRPGSA